MRRFMVLCAVSVVAALVGGATATAQPVQVQAVTIVGDLTGDGIADRVTLDNAGGGVCTTATEAGDGQGGFGVPSTISYANPAGHPANCPNLGAPVDLGGDGTKELVLSWFSGSMRPDFDIIAMRGSTIVGRFRGLTQPSRLGGGADFNGDGREDVWENSDQHVIFQTYLNTADGALVEGPAGYCEQRGAAQFEFADFDLDGATDIVAGYRCAFRHGAMVVLGDTGQQIPLVGNVSDVVTAVPSNVNGDALPDVKVTVGSDVSYYVNQGGGTFTLLDTTGPTVTITTPAEGATVPGIATYTVTGTASDATTGGGQVTGVQVSVDGGPWRAATGRENWTHEWTPSRAGAGAGSIRVRATDDSGNAGVEIVRHVNVGPQQCPCTVFGAATPARPDSGENAVVALGMKFSSSVTARVTGARFYKSPANTGNHTARLWSADGRLLAESFFASETPSGWQTTDFPTPVMIRAGTTYVISYVTETGHYAADTGYFAEQGAGIAPVTAPSGPVSGGNGVFVYGTGFPRLSSASAVNYWVDPVVSTDGVDVTPPTVAGTVPSASATAVATDAEVSATLSEDIDPTSVRFDVRAAGGPAVLGTVSTDGRTGTFVPNDLLAPHTTYTVTLDATDTVGNALTPAHTWSFTTGAAANGCPCTLLGGTHPGTVDAGDGGNVELGLKFVPAERTRATGVRYYKSAANTGVHTGSLWTTSGVRLATGTFTGETATGWQTLTFAEPVELAAGITYVASYHAPNGHYSSDLDHFATTGTTRGPLSAPSSPASGGNGLFQYGGGFPTDSYRSANYWVDVVVDTAGLDYDPPVVTTRTPGLGAIGAPTDSGVVVRFDEQVDPVGVTLTLTGPAGDVPGTTRVGDDLHGVSFAPDEPLPGNTRYTASVTATDIAGNAMASPVTWVFTTGADDNCPCTLFTVAEAPAGADAGVPVELGLRWRSDDGGFVSGVRFYKTLGDPGVHTGTLWSTSGVALATGTFTGETAAGWQTLVFDTPVAVTAETDYVVSYHSSAGRYGYTLDHLTTGHRRGPLSAPSEVANGLYRYGSGGLYPTGDGAGRNYWVDAVFTR